MRFLWCLSETSSIMLDFKRRKQNLTSFFKFYFKSVFKGIDWSVCRLALAKSSSSSSEIVKIPSPHVIVHFIVHFKNLNFQFWLFGHLPSLKVARREHNAPHILNSYLFLRFHLVSFSWSAHLSHTRSHCFIICLHSNLYFFLLPFIKVCHCIFL